jgi:hypothetical protein
VCVVVAAAFFFLTLLIVRGGDCSFLARLPAGSGARVQPTGHTHSDWQTTGYAIEFAHNEQLAACYSQ